MWSKLGPSEKAIVVICATLICVAALALLFSVLTTMFGPFTPFFVIFGLALLLVFFILRSGFKEISEIHSRYEPKKNRYGKQK